MSSPDATIQAHTILKQNENLPEYHEKIKLEIQPLDNKLEKNQL
jgi:hypothetical protein